MVTEVGAIKEELGKTTPNLCELWYGGAAGVFGGLSKLKSWQVGLYITNNNIIIRNDAGYNPSCMGTIK